MEQITESLKKREKQEWAKAWSLIDWGDFEHLTEGYKEDGFSEKKKIKHKKIFIAALFIRYYSQNLETT